MYHDIAYYPVLEAKLFWVTPRQWDYTIFLKSAKILIVLPGMLFLSLKKLTRASFTFIYLFVFFFFTVLLVLVPSSPSPQVCQVCELTMLLTA